MPSQNSWKLASFAVDPPGIAIAIIGSMLLIRLLPRVVELDFGPVPFRVALAVGRAAALVCCA